MHDSGCMIQDAGYRIQEVPNCGVRTHTQALSLKERD
jgi:hypothetical protein